MQDDVRTFFRDQLQICLRTEARCLASAARPASGASQAAAFRNLLCQDLRVNVDPEHAQCRCGGGEACTTCSGWLLHKTLAAADPAAGAASAARSMTQTQQVQQPLTAWGWRAAGMPSPPFSVFKVPGQHLLQVLDVVDTGESSYDQRQRMEREAGREADTLAGTTWNDEQDEDDAWLGGGDVMMGNDGGVGASQFSGAGAQFGGAGAAAAGSGSGGGPHGTAHCRQTVDKVTREDRYCRDSIDVFARFRQQESEQADAAAAAANDVSRRLQSRRKKLQEQGKVLEKARGPLKYCFSDGVTTLFALEVDPLGPALRRGMKVGSKVLLRNGPLMSHGLVLLGPQHLAVVSTP